MNDTAAPLRRGETQHRNIVHSPSSGRIVVRCSGRARRDTGPQRAGSSGATRGAALKAASLAL